MFFKGEVSSLYALYAKTKKVLDVNQKGKYIHSNTTDMSSQSKKDQFLKWSEIKKFFIGKKLYKNK